MRRGRAWWALAVAALAIAGGWAVWTYTDRAQTGEPDLRTAEAVRRDMGASVLATGVIKPMVGAEVRVGSRVSGIVHRLRANIGDRVEKGDVLAELDPTELQARVDQAAAALENNRAGLDYAQLDLERKRSLLSQAFVSQEQVDQAEKALRVAEAQVRQAEASLDYAKIQMGYTRITAPISGVVGSVSTQEGETVAASFSAPTFVTIIDLNRLEVWAYVDETDIGRIHPGQQARFTVDTYTDTAFEGVVTAVYPRAVIQDNVVNYIATIRIGDRKDRTLRPEMTATVTIALERRAGVVAVPYEAVRRERGERFVYVMEGQRAVRRPVEVGWRDGGFLEVRSGLTAGERVALDAPSVEEGYKDNGRSR